MTAAAIHAATSRGADRPRDWRRVRRRRRRRDWLVSLKRLQREREIARRLKSIVRIFLERVADDAVERRRQRRGRRRVEFRRIVAQNRRHRFGRRRRARTRAGRWPARTARRRARTDRAADRRPRRAPAPAPCSRPCRAPCRHRSRPSSACSREPAAGADCFRQPEVENLHVPVAQQHDVLGLQIAMDDAAIVRGGETARDLHRDVGALARGSGPCASRARSVSPSSSSVIM